MQRLKSSLWMWLFLSLFYCYTQLVNYRKMIFEQCQGLRHTCIFQLKIERNSNMLRCKWIVRLYSLKNLFDVLCFADFVTCSFGRIEKTKVEAKLKKECHFNRIEVRAESKEFLPKCTLYSNFVCFSEIYDLRDFFFIFESFKISNDNSSWHASLNCVWLP